MSALSRHHGVINTFWTEATKLTSDAFVEALGLDVHQVALVEEGDNVEAHALAHLSWIDSCSSSPVDASNLSTKMGMWLSFMSTTAKGCLVELDVGAQASRFLHWVLGFINSAMHALIHTLLLAVVWDVLQMKTISLHS
jgi:hypothetical protein